MLIARLHALLAKVGISPKVADPFLIGLVALAAAWISTGTFDSAELKLLALNFAYALIGVAAPPTAGLSQKAVDKLGKK